MVPVRLGLSYHKPSGSGTADEKTAGWRRLAGQTPTGR
jgi:hypothetical protein